MLTGTDYTVMLGTANLVLGYLTNTLSHSHSHSYTYGSERSHLPDLRCRQLQTLRMNVHTCSEYTQMGTKKQISLSSGIISSTFSFKLHLNIKLLIQSLVWPVQPLPRLLLWGNIFLLKQVFFLSNVAHIERISAGKICILHYHATVDLKKPQRNEYY